MKGCDHFGWANFVQCIFNPGHLICIELGHLIQSLILNAKSHSSILLAYQYICILLENLKVSRNKGSHQPLASFNLFLHLVSLWINHKICPLLNWCSSFCMNSMGNQWGLFWLFAEELETSAISFPDSHAEPQLENATHLVFPPLSLQVAQGLSIQATLCPLPSSNLNQG